jgi:hypothetical protein
MGVKARESFLGEVFAAMLVIEHADAEAMDGSLPFGDELGEGVGVVGRADAPHELLIRSGWGEETG